MDTSNGLGNWMAAANFTVVGALLVVFVGGFFWLMFHGLPRAFGLVSELIQSSQESQALARKEFIDALSAQQAGRLEAAKGGHDAAMRIADNVHELTVEVRRLNVNQHEKQSGAVNNRLEAC